MVPAEVLALIEERQKVENWVAKLDDLKADTTPAVFTKVEDDYQSRLAELNTGLAEHHTELQASLEERSALVTKLQAERDEQAESLEEANLRFTVGEFDQPEWDIRREEGEKGLAELDEQLGEEKSAVEELESVIFRMAGAGEGPEATLAGVTAVAAGDALASLEQELEPEEDQEESSSDETVHEEDLEGDEGGASDESTWAEADADPLVAESDTTVEDQAEVEGQDLEEESAEQESVEADIPVATGSGEKGEGFMDELEFLESLSLDEANKFDAVSAMLDEEEQSDGGEAEEQSP